jgi:hypothetical protein
VDAVEAARRFPLLAPRGREPGRYAVRTVLVKELLVEHACPRCGRGFLGVARRVFCAETCRLREREKRQLALRAKRARTRRARATARAKLERLYPETAL